MSISPIEKAITEIGVHDNPLGSNNVKYNTWYYSQTVSGSGYPWCAVFVYWCYCKIGAKSRIAGVKNHAYCPSYVEWAKQNGKVKKSPKRGYLVMFDWNKDGEADHIGFVDEYDNNARLLKTVEGNHDHRVSFVTRKYSDVMMYIDAQGAKNVTQTSGKKSIETIAREVINGDWGNGETRKKKLKAAGYSYSKVQARVNEILKGK